MQRQLLTTMAPRFTLTYFDIRGKAEVIRLMFAASGVEFEDKRIAVEDWSKIKPSKFAQHACSRLLPGLEERTSS